jgi:protein phosphatase
MVEDQAGTRRPEDEDLDMFGITHKGKVRADNQDQFLISTVHPQILVHNTSIPNPERLPLRGTRLGTVLILADGVGGAAAGSEASRIATEAVTTYVSSTLRSYHAAGSTFETELLDQMKSAALEAHATVKAESAKRTDNRHMATTLTACIIVWPWAYVVQVGDSRAYFYDKDLVLLTRDQTIAQALVDQGIMPAERLDHSPLKHVLSSAIGADSALPVVTKFDITNRGACILMCSDGLTKHVKDAELADYLRNMKNSEQLARDLLQLALDRGGTDNITIIAARALPAPPIL